ncbi:MAG: glutathione binding-like protein [Pseudomonadota bacterium]
MKLYFRPFACSLAARIALIEGEIDAEFVRVEPGRPLPDGRPFTAISPMGYVPAIETRAGFVLTEGTAVLTYIAELAPPGALAPPAYTDAHYRMLAWLNFVSTELHKGVFMPLMYPHAGEGERTGARLRLPRAFEALAAHLAARDHLEGGFTVADAYLLSVLNWCEHAGVAIGEWPVLKAYRARLRARPSVAAAMAEEYPLLAAA